MYESKFLNQFRSFAAVDAYVKKQFQIQPFLGPIDTFESSYCPNRSFFYGKIIGALRLYLDTSMIIGEEELLPEDLQHNEALINEYRLLNSICYTLFRHGDEFHPRMPQHLQFRYIPPTKELQKQYNEHRNTPSFIADQFDEYEAQFLKINKILQDEKMRVLFENELSSNRTSLSFNAQAKFIDLSKSINLLTEREKHATLLKKMHIKVIEADDFSQLEKEIRPCLPSSNLNHFFHHAKPPLPSVPMSQKRLVPDGIATANDAENKSTTMPNPSSK